MRITSILICLAAGLLLPGCREKQAEAYLAAPVNRAESELEKVSLQLNWFPETEHGGYYHAQLAGIYRQAGLEVEIFKGGPNTPVEVQTAAGRVDFGIVNADKLLATRVEGVKLVGLLAPFQTSPRCIIVRASSPVTSLAELAKAETLIANHTKPFVAFLQHTYDLSDLKIIPYKGGMSTFLANENHAIQGYVTSEPLIIERRGVPNRSLLLADAGFNPYTSVLVTSESMLATRPELVRRLVRASQQGWLAYLADPALANREIKRLNPELEDEVLTYGAEHLKPLMLTDETRANGFGSMTEARWLKLRDQLIECGSIAAYPETIANAYTNDFLDPAAK